MEIKLKKGQSVYRSEQGSRGFYYPSSGQKIFIKEDCVGLRVSGYMSYGDKEAYSVPTDAVVPRDRYAPEKPYMIIWK